MESKEAIDKINKINENLELIKQSQNTNSKILEAINEYKKMEEFKNG